MGDAVRYLVPDLLHFLKSKGGEKLQIEVGVPPLLKIKGENFEIDGPLVTDEVAGALLRSIADTRQIRDFREHGILEFVHEFESSRFLVQVKKEYGYVRLDFYLLTAEQQLFRFIAPD